MCSIVSFCRVLVENKSGFYHIHFYYIFDTCIRKYYYSKSDKLVGMRIRSLFAVLFGILVVLVEIRSVSCVFKRRLIGWYDLQTPSLFPIDFSKPWMLFDVVYTILQVPESFRQISRQQVLYQIFGICIEMRWESYASLQNLFIQLNVFLIIEWWVS